MKMLINKIIMDEEDGEYSVLIRIQFEMIMQIVDNAVSETIFLGFVNQAHATAFMRYFLSHLSISLSTAHWRELFTILFGIGGVFARDMIHDLLIHNVEIDGLDVPETIPWMNVLTYFCVNDWKSDNCDVISMLVLEFGASIHRCNGNSKNALQMAYEYSRYPNEYIPLLLHLGGNPLDIGNID